MVMGSLFSALSVPQLSRLARRTALAALGLAVAGLVVSFVVGHWLFGVGLCLGLSMAMANFRSIARSASEAAAPERQRRRRRMAANTLVRLGVISAVCLLLAWLVGSLGFGAIVGLALFQFTLLSNVVLTVARDPA